MRRLGPCLAFGALMACAGAPLPDDLQRAQQLEAGRRDEEALAAYAAAQGRCQRAGARPHDDCGMAAFRQAQMLERMSRYQEAAQGFVAVRDLTTDGRLSARSLLRAAILHAERLSQTAEALRLCRLIVSRWPDELAAEDALGLQVRLMRDDPGLVAELDRVASSLARHAVSGWALLYRAEYAEKEGPGGVQLGVKLYDELWRRFPQGPLRDDAAFRAALLLRRAGRPAEAAERLVQLQKTFVSSIVVGHYNKLLLDDAALLLGQIYLEDLREPEKAIAALEGFLNRQPTSLYADDALLLMARAALVRHEPATAQDKREACTHLGRLLLRYPDGNMARSARNEKGRLGC